MSNKYILICIFSLNVLATSGSGVIIESKYKERHEGDDVKFMWNSTSGQIITSATFGLSKDGLPNPQFINVNILTGQVTTNNETDNRFAGRVYFIGNLTAGHAWFVIRNLEINDTSEYIARISVGGSTTESYVVQLVVQRSSDKGQKDQATTTTAEIPFYATLNGISSTVFATQRTTISDLVDFTGKAKSQGLHVGAIAGIVMAVFLVVISTVGVVVLVILKRKKKNKNKDNTEMLRMTLKGPIIHDL